MSRFKILWGMLKFDVCVTNCAFITKFMLRIGGATEDKTKTTAASFGCYFFFFPAERLSRLAVCFHELKIRYGCLKYFVASMSMLHRSYRPKSLDQHVISFSWIGPISCLSVYIFSDMCHQLKFIDSFSSTRFCDETVQIRQNEIKWSVIHCFLRWQWPFVTNPKVEQWIRPSTFFWTWRKYSI